MAEKALGIKEVSQMYNISANKLRFYEKKGLITPSRHPESGYRQYFAKDLLTIQAVLMYRTLEISIEDIKVLLENKSKDELIEQVFNQWDTVNGIIHKYRLIQESLGSVIDGFIESGSESELQESVIQAGETTGRYIEIQSNWQDKWNFDEWAESYDECVAGNSGKLNFYENYHEVLDRVYEISKENLTSGSSILEIGVGTGNLASKYLSDSISIVGLDQSRKMLYEARKKHGNLKLRLGEFLKLPFCSNSFDRIVTTYAFHHLTDIEKEFALKEMVRVLKGHGEIIIGDIMFENNASKDQFLGSLSEREKKAVEDEYYTNIEEFGKVVTMHGFSYSVERVDTLMHIVRVFI